MAELEHLALQIGGASLNGDSQATVAPRGDYDFDPGGGEAAAEKSPRQIDCDVVLIGTGRNVFEGHGKLATAAVEEMRNRGQHELFAVAEVMELGAAGEARAARDHRSGGARVTVGDDTIYGGVEQALAGCCATLILGAAAPADSHRPTLPLLETYMQACMFPGRLRANNPCDPFSLGWGWTLRVRKVRDSLRRR